MAAAGKIAFASAYAAFSPGRNWEQIKTTICLNDVPVVVASTHAGLLTGPDGATHQMLEDIALMRVLPNMTVISPCDAEEGRKATLAAARLGKPVYLRFAREKLPTITTRETPFEVGRAIVLWRPQSALKAALFATGPILNEALLAARSLDALGIGVTVINVHTIKPLDTDVIRSEAERAGRVVTLEEHQVAGGLGSAIAEALAPAPVPLTIIGVEDRYGTSGKATELWDAYGISAKHVEARIRGIVDSVR